MKVVVGLGGHALLRKDEPLTGAAQQRNVVNAAKLLGRIAREHRLVVTHGNGPQVGLLALQDAEMPESGNFSLDVLGAETEGMIGYLLAQELRNEVPDTPVASILTQVEVDPADPGFRTPTKPVGPIYDEAAALRLAETRGWTVARVQEGFRRVVPSPAPLRVLEIDTIRLLVDAGTVVICAGGGGIPVVFGAWGRVRGVEAVIDKDRSAGLVAKELGADMLLLLTDVKGVELGWGTPDARVLRDVTVSEIRAMDFPNGSMGPKVEAATSFVEESGGIAAIGALEDAQEILNGKAGTRIHPDDGSRASVGS